MITDKENKEKMMSFRLNSNLHRRLKMRLAEENTTFQATMEKLMIAYLDGPEGDRAEIARQVALAKEIMQEYAPAMRELAR